MERKHIAETIRMQLAFAMDLFPALKMFTVDVSDEIIVTITPTDNKVIGGKGFALHWDEPQLMATHEGLIVETTIAAMFGLIRQGLNECLEDYREIVPSVYLCFEPSLVCTEEDLLALDNHVRESYSLE